MKNWTCAEAEELYRRRDFSTLYADNYEGLRSYVCYARVVGLYEIFANLVCEIVAPKTLLDVGCGKGDLVDILRKRGISAWGFDASDYIFDGGFAHEYLFMLDILSDPWLFGQAIFDTISIFEVLEHFMEEDIDLVLDRICFSAKNFIIGTISEDPVPSEHFCTKPREWWNDKFASRGFEVAHVGDFPLSFASYYHPCSYRRRKGYD